jgi:hypothetical protein
MEMSKVFTVRAAPAGWLSWQNLGMASERASIDEITATASGKLSTATGLSTGLDVQTLDW